MKALQKTKILANQALFFFRLLTVNLIALVFLSSINPKEAEKKKENKTILLAILARNKEHVLPKFLDCIDKLDYNKKLITVYINTNNNEDSTKSILEEWIKKSEKHYKSVLFENYEIQDMPPSKPHEWTFPRLKILGAIRDKSLRIAKEYGCDYYFVVDCDNFIKPSTLKFLLSKDKPIIAPLLKSRPYLNDTYSNYFCDVLDTGYYKDHPDYMKIWKKEMIGTFKAPVVHCTYLINSNYIDKLSYLENGSNDYEFIIFSRSARKNGVNQYICNEEDFGVSIHFFDNPSLQEESKRVKDYLEKGDPLL